SALPSRPASTPAPAPAPSPSTGLPWIHDDLVAARARAQATGRPLVVDLWAAWCHTCISMQETVLRDPSLVGLADRFVWLALDTERESNAAALEALPVEVWPTFYVVSPDGAIQARHVGAGTVGQVRAFLDAGEAGHLDALAAKGGL